MTPWTEPDRCAICGWTVGRELRTSLVKWADAEPGMQYDHIVRCKDEAACRARLSLEGKPWPLAERAA